VQDLGLGLTVNQVRRVAFRVADAAGMNHPFSRQGQMTGWYRRDKLGERYNLSLWTPENLSTYRRSTANRTLLNDFHDKEQNLLTEPDLRDEPSCLWNCDETGLTYVMKYGKTVCRVGRKYVSKQRSGEKGVTTTLLCCICASEMSVPPMVIFRGVRINDPLGETPMPSLVRLSPKGWIAADLFAEWVQHFIECTPSHRLVILFLDSHASHITHEILSKASDNGTHPVTFPSHTTRL
jgi:hypothetical protein